MADSFFGQGDARLYAQKFIVRGIREGLSGNQILQNLRSVQIGDQTLGYRTEMFYQDYNRYLTSSRTPTLRGLPTLPGGVVTGYSLVYPTSGGNRFMYTQVMRGRDQQTGEIVHQPISIVSPIPIDATLQQAALVNAFQDFDYKVNLLPTQTSDITEYQFYYDAPAPGLG